jgi:hypothetical protein
MFDSPYWTLYLFNGYATFELGYDSPNADAQMFVYLSDSTDTIVDGLFHIIRVSRQDGSVTLYIDNVVRDVQPDGGYNIVASDVPILISAQLDQSGVTAAFVGDIANASIYIDIAEGPICDLQATGYLTQNTDACPQLLGFCSPKKSTMTTCCGVDNCEVCGNYNNCTQFFATTTKTQAQSSLRTSSVTTTSVTDTTISTTHTTATIADSTVLFVQTTMLPVVSNTAFVTMPVTSSDNGTLNTMLNSSTTTSSRTIAARNIDTSSTSTSVLLIGSTTTAALGERVVASSPALPLAAIVGGVVGGLLLLLVIGVIIFCAMRRRRTQSTPAAVLERPRESEPMVSIGPGGSYIDRVTNHSWRGGVCVCVCVCVYADYGIISAVLPPPADSEYVFGDVSLNETYARHTATALSSDDSRGSTATYISLGST